MDLYLRKVIHPTAADNFRVVLKQGGDDETEIGSIGVQPGTVGTTLWVWSIDTVIPMRVADKAGRGTDRADCMRRFDAAWTRFASDQANLTMFLAEKRKVRR
jgi:hypothetical protein